MPLPVRNAIILSQPPRIRSSFLGYCGYEHCMGGCSEMAFGMRFSRRWSSERMVRQHNLPATFRYQVDRLVSDQALQTRNGRLVRHDIGTLLPLPQFDEA